MARRTVVPDELLRSVRIERNVPPPGKPKRPRLRYAFLPKMKKGESVALPKRYHPQLYAACHAFGRRAGRTFLVLRNGKETRAWRTK